MTAMIRSFMVPVGSPIALTLTTDIGILNNSNMNHFSLIAPEPKKAE